MYFINPTVLVLDDVRVAEARHQGHLCSKQQAKHQNQIIKPNHLSRPPKHSIRYELEKKKKAIFFNPSRSNFWYSQKGFADATANNSWVQHVCSSVGNEQELTRFSVWFTSWYAVRWNLSFCLDSRIFFITYLHHHRAKKEQKHQGSLKKTKEEEERGAEEGGEPLALALVDDEVCGAVGAPADLLHHLVLLHGSGSGSGSAPRCVLLPPPPPYSVLAGYCCLGWGTRNDASALCSAPRSRTS